MNTLDKAVEVAKGKLDTLKKGVSRYFMSSILGGMYVGIGVAFMATAGAMVKEGGSSSYKLIMGVTFSVALSLVLMAGADLFTGNNMVMTIAYLKKEAKGIDLLKIWGISYIGNFVGSLLFAGMFLATGLASKGTGAFLVSLAESKINLPIGQMFFRAILCNLLVCLSVWCYIKLKEETAKLIMIFWCIFAFAVMGFEHSVANMTLLSLAYMIPHTAGVTIGGIIYNLSVVTIGNIIGGALFVGAAYYYILRD